MEPSRCDLPAGPWAPCGEAQTHQRLLRGQDSSSVSSVPSSAARCASSQSRLSPGYRRRGPGFVAGTLWPCARPQADGGGRRACASLCLRTIESSSLAVTHLVRAAWSSVREPTCPQPVSWAKGKSVVALCGQAVHAEAGGCLRASKARSVGHHRRSVSRIRGARRGASGRHGPAL